MNSIKLKVNGVDRTVEDVDPATPLLWVLRDHLGLVGTKFGCGRALCGACTVHMNGAPIRSCSIPAATVSGFEITTIEGLAGSDGSLHPLQESWMEHDVPQCGYCQSGQIMTAAFLLKSIPSPTDEEISSIMSGNLCRCGTYKRIHAAIKTAAKKGGEG